MPKRLTTPEIFAALEATPKKLEKLAILEQHKGNGELMRIFEYALNPYKQYGIKKIPNYTSGKMIGFTLNSVLKRLDLLANRQITGNAAIEYLAKILAEMPADEAEIVERVIKKDMRCGVQSKTVNKVWPNLIHEFPCMLCSTYDDKNIAAINYPAYSQIKMDGMRVNFIVNNKIIEIRSRSGKELFIVNAGLNKEILDVVGASNGIVLDGELLVSDGKGGYLPRKEGNGILIKAIKGTISDEEAALINVVLWDAITLPEFKVGKWDYPYSKRFKWLEDAIEKAAPSKVKLVESEIVDSFFFAKRMFEKATARGDEGIILKNVNSIWENKRSKGQVKMKVEEEAEFIIQDIIEGTGKYEGMLGSFFVSTSDGLLEVSVGSGFSDEQRDEYFNRKMVGKIITVKYNEVIQTKKGENSLFLPIFIEIREDKSEANSLSELK